MSNWNLSFRQGRVSGPGSNCSYQLKTTPGSQILVTFLKFDLAPALESVGCAKQAVSLEEPIHSSTSLLLQKKIFCGSQVLSTNGFVLFSVLSLCTRCQTFPAQAASSPLQIRSRSDTRPTRIQLQSWVLASRCSPTNPSLFPGRGFGHQPPLCSNPSVSQLRISLMQRDLRGGAACASTFHTSTSLSRAQAGGQGDGGGGEDAHRRSHCHHHH